jgi:phage protein D
LKEEGTVNENTRLTPTWIVYADGRRLDTEHEGALRRVFINDRLSAVSVFSLEFQSSAVPVRDRGFLSLGSRVEIHLGYKDAVEKVFEGDILGFKTTLSGLRPDRIAVRGAGDLHRLHHGKHYRGFGNKSAAQIIRALAEIHSLKAKVEDFGAEREFSAARDETDLELVIKLAAFYGKEVYASDGTLYAASEITPRPDQIIYEWGKSLAEFEAEENIQGLVPAYTACGWDSEKNEGFTARVQPEDMPLRVGGTSHWSSLVRANLSAWESLCADPRYRDAEDARASAAALLQKNSFRFGRGRGSGEGNCKLRPGMRVTIKAAGDAFSGEYIADSVCHRFDQLSGYRTDFTLKRNMSPC